MSGRGMVIVLGAAVAALGGYLFWRSRQAAAAAIPATAATGPSFIDQAKAAALAPAPAPVASGPDIGALLGAGLDLLTSLGGLGGAAPAGAGGAGAAPSAAPAPTGTNPNPAPHPPAYDMGALATPAPSGGVANMLNVIASGEANNGYDSVYGGAKVAPPQPISTMTVGQVQAYQQQMAAAGSASTAVGRYQFIGGTLGDLVNQGVLSPSQPFDATAQDTAAVALMQRRGLAQYQAGTISADAFANNLAHEWASLPLVSGPTQGQSAYAGDGLNAARVSVPTVMSAISNI